MNLWMSKPNIAIILVSRVGPSLDYCSENLNGTLNFSVLVVQIYDYNLTYIISHPKMLTTTRCYEIIFLWCWFSWTSTLGKWCEKNLKMNIFSQHGQLFADDEKKLRILRKIQIVFTKFSHDFSQYLLIKSEILWRCHTVDRLHKENLLKFSVVLKHWVLIFKMGCENKTIFFFFLNTFYYA